MMQDEATCFMDEGEKRRVKKYQLGFNGEG